MKLNELTEYLDALLRINEIEDDSVNGLQVECTQDIQKVGLAVDASFAAFETAVTQNIDLLFVHHGLYWGKSVPAIGAMYQRLATLIKSNTALYAAHLPLDMHPQFGNNAQIKDVLGWPLTKDFGDYHGNILGKEIQFPEEKPLSEIADEITKNLQCDITVWDFGTEKVKTAGYVSGGGIGILEQAIAAGYDLYITGEPKHSAYWVAKEAGINVIFAGHYATETLGVRAVGKHLNEKFGLEIFDIDLPTGL